MSLIWSWALIFLLFIPLAIWGYVVALKKRQQSLKALSALGLVQNGSDKQPGWRRHAPPLFLLLGLAFLLFSLSRPEMYVDLPRFEGTVILAFDVSNSMLAEDLEPNRIEAAKNAARIFVENQPAAIRIGVVAFSNGGLVVQTPTDDRTAVMDTLDRLTPQGATSLGQGIFTALNAIAGEPISIDPAILDEVVLSEEGLVSPDGVLSLEIGYFPSSVVLLFTDGENTAAPDPIVIAQIASEAGVRIFPIGIGSPQGTVLQVDGFSVLSSLDEGFLKEIASLTNGSYYHASDEESMLEVYKQVDLGLSIRGEKMEVTAVFAGLGLVFLLTAGALSFVWFGRIP